MNREILQLLDIAAPEAVEVIIDRSGKRVWVNVDDLCRLRICRAKHLLVSDSKEAEE